jgi:preprotein translocase SecF subunit
MKIDFTTFVQRRRYFYIFSSIILVLGLLSMVYVYATTGSFLRLSVDFLGGTRFEVQFTALVSEEDIRAVFESYDLHNPTVTAIRGQDLENAWQIRTAFVQSDEVQAIQDSLNDLAPLIPGTVQVTTVSPAVGREVTQAALVAVLVAAIIILGYIMFVFRQVSHAFRYGACAVVAMFHDLFVVISFAALTGAFLGWEIDALFLTAVLTVVGFSLQDTIVVFDRIRENLGLRQNRGKDYETIVNMSIGDTFKRSVITQLNAMFIMVAILLFGGDSVKPFIAVLFVGLLSGTYSSIFIASPLLVSWEKGEIPLLRQRQQA